MFCCHKLLTLQALNRCKTTIRKSVIDDYSSFSCELMCIRNHKVASRINLAPCGRKYLLWKLWINVSLLSLKCVFIFVEKKVVNRKVLKREISLIQIKMSAWRQCLSLGFLFFLFLLQQESVLSSKLRHRWNSVVLTNREFCKHFLQFWKYTSGRLEMFSHDLHLHFEFIMKPEALWI